MAIKLTASSEGTSISKRINFLASLKVNEFHEDLFVGIRDKKRKFYLLVNKVIPRTDIVEQEILIGLKHITISQLRHGIDGMLLGYSFSCTCKVLKTLQHISSVNVKRGERPECLSYDLEGKNALKGLLIYRNCESFTIVPDRLNTDKYSISV